MTKKTQSKQGEDSQFKVVDRRVLHGAEEPKEKHKSKRELLKEGDRKRKQREKAERVLAADAVPPGIANPATLPPHVRAAMAKSREIQSPEINAVKAVIKGVVIPMVSGVAKKLQQQIGINAKAIDAVVDATETRFHEAAEVGNNAQALVMSLMRLLGMRGIVSYEEIVETYNQFVALKSNEAVQVFLRGKPVGAGQEEEKKHVKQVDAARQDDEDGAEGAEQGDLPEVRPNGGAGEPVVDQPGSEEG